MSEPIPNPFDPFFEKIREIVREEIKAAMGNGKNESPKKDWLKAEELAADYGLPKTWFEERGRAGDIARCKPGRYVLFKRRDVEAYLDGNKGTEWPKRKRQKRDRELTSSERRTT